MRLAWLLGRRWACMGAEVKGYVKDVVYAWACTKYVSISHHEYTHVQFCICQ